MSPDEARALLGLPTPATPDEVRAAWLARARSAPRDDLARYGPLREACVALGGADVATFDDADDPFDLPWSTVCDALDGADLAYAGWPAEVAWRRGALERLARALVKWAPDVAAGGPSPRVPLGVYGRAALWLFARGEHGLAFALVDACRTLAPLPHEFGDLPILLLAEELASAGEGVPGEIRQLIAGSLLTGAPCADQLTKLARARPGDARAAYRAFRRARCPSVLRRFGRALSPGPDYRLDDLILTFLPHPTWWIGATVAMLAAAAMTAWAWRDGHGMTALALAPAVIGVFGAGYGLTCLASALRGWRARRPSDRLALGFAWLMFAAVAGTGSAVAGAGLTMWSREERVLSTAREPAGPLTFLEADVPRDQLIAWDVPELVAESDAPGDLGIAARRTLETCALLRAWWLPGCGPAARSVRRVQAGICPPPGELLIQLVLTDDMRAELWYNDQKLRGALVRMCARPPTTDP